MPNGAGHKLLVEDINKSIVELEKTPEPDSVCPSHEPLARGVATVLKIQKYALENSEKQLTIPVAKIASIVAAVVIGTAEALRQIVAYFGSLQHAP